MEAYAAGQRIFGESHAQELARKAAALPADIDWHFIGHLQTNKVKAVVPHVSMVQSVDSVRLLEEIDKQAVKCGRVVDVLIELHMAREEAKFGFTPGECRSFIAGGMWKSMGGIRIRGLMMMATNTDDEAVVRAEMQAAADLFAELKDSFFADDDHFDQRSWGMSQDWRIAVGCSSTMVRVGTAIFGPRAYNETLHT